MILVYTKDGLPKVLGGKVLCCDAISISLVKDMIFFNECAAINFPRNVSEQQICNGQFLISKKQSAWFDFLFQYSCFLWSRRLLDFCLSNTTHLFLELADALSFDIHHRKDIWKQLY